MAPCPQPLLLKCVGGPVAAGQRRAELVLALSARPGPTARGKVLGVMLRLCPTARRWQLGEGWGATPGQRLGENKGGAERGGGGLSS